MTAHPKGFESLNGWPDDDHLAAMAAFLKTARRMVERPYKPRAFNIASPVLVDVARKALAHGRFDQKTAREFFESHFLPIEVVEDGAVPNGFVTAYYEPEVPASRTKTAQYSAPLYSRPEDLVDINADNRPKTMSAEYRFARLGKNRELGEYPDRAAIEAGYLQGKGLEIAFVKDKVEALFIHIQGSARLCFEDGSHCRIGYAAKSGHPYTPVGRILLDRGELTRKKCGMQDIRNWFSDNPHQIENIINGNRSFIFFKEQYQSDGGPIGAAKVPLTANRSLAVDRLLHTFGVPLWIETALPLPGSKVPFRKLMVAQDTGSAIVGPARGDIFLGSGDEAGKIAGDVRHNARFVILAPKENF